MEVEEEEYEKIRELTGKSSRELCFGQKNICAIYLSEGKINDKVTDEIDGFSNKFASKSDRGIKYNWMYLDVSVEAEFKKAIEDQEPR